MNFYSFLFILLQKIRLFVELNIKGPYDISWKDFCVKLSTSQFIPN